MNATLFSDKLWLFGRMTILTALITLPLSAQAEYYLVAGPCDACVPTYYRTVHKVHKVYKPHKVYKHKIVKHKCIYKKYVRTRPHRYSHYTMTVYYPVPCNTCQTPCNTCGGGFMEPNYYWAPTSTSGVYYMNPSDRIVYNRYEAGIYDPSMDTGTADNDIY